MTRTPGLGRWDSKVPNTFLSPTLPEAFVRLTLVLYSCLPPAAEGPCDSSAGASVAKGERKIQPGGEQNPLWCAWGILEDCPPGKPAEGWMRQAQQAMCRTG